MFEIYIEDSQADKEHIVECIMGKKIVNNEIEYAVRWQEFSETTWEPLSSFNYQSEYLIKQVIYLSLRRFERCQAYYLYWSQLTSEKQQQGKRVHIIGNQIQVQQKLIKQQKESLVDNYKKRQEYFENNNYLFDDDLIIRKIGVRGRPKLNMNLISQDCSEYIQDHMKDENSRRGKFEKDVIFEIIHYERAKQAEKLPSNFITEMIQNTRAIQQELQEQQYESLRVYNQSTIYEEQQEPQFIFYDFDLKQIVIDFETSVEFITSHQLIKNKLLFKCVIKDMQVYGTYEVLTSKCPTLLVDYLIENAILV